jgi:hypothetical protein
LRCALRRRRYSGIGASNAIGAGRKILVDVAEAINRIPVGRMASELCDVREIMSSLRAQPLEINGWRLTINCSPGGCTRGESSISCEKALFTN